MNCVINSVSQVYKENCGERENKWGNLNWGFIKAVSIKYVRPDRGEGRPKAYAIIRREVWKKVRL
jgi:hypothetical protein